MITISTNLIVGDSTSSNSVTKLTHVPVSFIPAPSPPILMQQDTIYDEQENFNFIQQQQENNWSERILQDVIGLLHILSPTGKVLYCSESCIELTGYSPFELIGKSLTDFIHTDDLDIFARNFQLAFTSLSRIKTHYRIRRKDNTYILLESIGHPKQDIPHQPPQCFFGIAQPYLSRSNGLMDSFLELKMENEWLKKRLHQLLQDTSFQPPYQQQQQQQQQGQQHQLQQQLHNPQQQYFSTADRRPSNCSSTLFGTNNRPDDQLRTSSSWKSELYSPPVNSNHEFNEIMIRYNEDHPLDYLSSNTSVTTSTDKWKRRVNIFKHIIYKFLKPFHGIKNI